MISILLMVMTGWAMISQIGEYSTRKTPHLLGIGILIILLELWMIIEAVRAIGSSRRKRKT
ncbi:MAG: hypothetical protein U1E27_02970 [Kiritimatiellia bacterium]|nr:hypothetical protein [Kiritimatiellia bacterium]